MPIFNTGRQHFATPALAPEALLWYNHNVSINRQIPIYIGVIAAAHCFVFATQSTVASVSLFIVSFMIFNTILPMFNMVLGWDMNVTLLFPLYQCIELVNFDVSAINYATIYGSTLLYILLFVWLGYAKFKKSEIK